MNLMQQIQAASKACPTLVQKPYWSRCQQAAWEAHTKGSIESYREVMEGCGWLTQRQIEYKLGYAATSSAIFLRRLKDDFKLIERRNRDGDATYSRKRGYEWRWKDEQK